MTRQRHRDGRRDWLGGRRAGDPRLARARPGSAARWGAAALAVLANGLILGALAANLAPLRPVGEHRRDGDLKLFALPAPASPSPIVAARPALSPRRAAAVPAKRASGPPSDPVAALSRPPARAVPEPITMPPMAAVAAAPVIAPPASGLASPSVPATEADGGADRAWADYQRMVWNRIVVRRPRGFDMPGEALLRFTLDGQGALVSADLARSSGSAMLDRLALRTLHAAAPFPPPPAGIGDRPLRFTVRFSFH